MDDDDAFRRRPGVSEQAAATPLPLAELPCKVGGTDETSLNALGDEGSYVIGSAVPSSGVEHDSSVRRNGKAVAQPRGGKPNGPLDPDEAAARPQPLIRDEYVDWRRGERSPKPDQGQRRRARQHGLRSGVKESRP